MAVRILAALFAVLALHLPARAEPAPLPGWGELEKAGARVGTIRIVTEPIFDTADPQEDIAIFRFANRLHATTKPAVIERALLLRPGDPVTVQRVEESERLLRAHRFLADVQIRPVAWHDGVVDVEVTTRDNWSLDVGASAGRSGGRNTGGAQLREYNLFGTGTTIGIGRSKGIDRAGTGLQLSNAHALGPYTGFAYDLQQNDDGRRQALVAGQPFYSIDTRKAAQVTMLSDDRLDATYDAGRTTSEFRHRQRVLDAWAGMSQGLGEGWVDRYSLGVQWQEDRYALEPGRLPPVTLPADEKTGGPYLRWQRLQDRFQRELNRNLIGRPEYFALGLAMSAQVGLSRQSWGATRDALVYAASISGGLEPGPGQTLVGAASVSGQWSGGEVQRQRAHAEAQYYARQGARWLFFAGGQLDMLTRPAAGDALLLGGDNGLRGYPAHYQSGSRRALFTVEERFYTDVYLWRLFRIGGAAFVDAGRAWGGPLAGTLDPGWLADAGVGLRIVSTRAAFSNVLHIDLAAPLNARGPDPRKVQLLVKTRTSF